MKTLKNNFDQIAIVVILLMIFLLSCLLVGCSGTNEQSSMLDKSENISRFVLVEKVGNDSTYDAIYVDTKTGVQYFVHREFRENGHSTSWGTVLMGKDGLPLTSPEYVR